MYYSGGIFFERWADMQLLTQEEKNGIEQKARRFLVDNHAAKMPIEPEALAQSVGLSVRYASIPGNTIGKLNKDDRVIVVDEWLKSDSAYARCVIAHELGHWCLEENTLGEAAMASGSESEIKELAASLFARAMLMPRPYLEKAVEIYNEKKRQEFGSLTDYVTALFRVTNRKAKLRLEECGFGQFA